jgi:hypothetical protein
MQFDTQHKERDGQGGDGWGPEFITRAPSRHAYRMPGLQAQCGGYGREGGGNRGEERGDGPWSGSGFLGGRGLLAIREGRGDASQQKCCG